MSENVELRYITTASDQGAGSLFDSLGGKIDGLGKMAAGVAAGGLVALGGGLGALGVTSVNAAADFEKSLSSIEAVSGATAAEMEQINGLALQLGADTAYSASEAAAGIEELLKGGLTIPDVMNGAAASMLNLAAAGDVAIPEAAEIAANAMAMFSLEGGEMAHVADLIAGAANASSLSVSDFKFSMSAAGSIAATTGQSFDDLAEAIAIMGKAGIKGSDAGTSLKTMLMNLQPSTKAQAGEFRKLGILQLDVAKGAKELGLAEGATADQVLEAASIWARQQAILGGAKEGTKAYAKEHGKLMASFEAANSTNLFVNANGQFKSMAEIAEILQEKTAGLTQAQKLQSLEVMFGSDAIRAAAIMAKEGGEGFEAMAAAMGKVTAESVAATRLDNFRGAVDALSGSWDTFTIVLGQQVLPILTPLVTEYITPAINGLSAFATSIFTASDPLLMFAQSLGSVSPGLSAIAFYLIDLVRHGQDLGGWLATTPALFQVLVGAVLPLLGALQPIVDLISANLIPILASMAAVFSGLVVVGIASAVAAFVAATWPIMALVAAGALLFSAWQSNFGGIRDLVTSSLGVVQGVVQTVLASIAATWTERIGIVVAFAQQAFPLIQSIVQTVFGIIAGFLQQHGASIVATLMTAWTTIQSAINVAITAVGTIVTTIFGAIATFLQQNSGSIQALLSQAWLTIQTVISAAVAVINGIIIPAFTTIAGFIASHKDQIVGLLQGAWDIIKGVVSAALSIVQGTIQTVMSVIRGDWSGAWEGIKTIVGGVWDGIKSVVEGAITIVKNLLTLGWDSAINVVSGIWGRVKTAITSPIEAAQGVVSSVIDTIKGYIQSGIDTVNGLIGAINSIPALPDLPTIPGVQGYAKGTSFAPGGLALVGEEGPELVNLPRGSQVFTNTETRDLLGSAPAVTNNYFQIEAHYAHEPEHTLQDDVRLWSRLGIPV